MAFGLIGLMSAGVANAEPNISFSGFGSIGALYSNSDNLGFHRDYTMEAVGQGWSTAGDTMLGLQLNADLPAGFDAVAQMVFKDRVSNENRDNLEWLFLRYKPNRDWAVRAGRLGLDLYMLTEYRDVGYAYPWVRPVPEFYNLISSISRFDGVDVSYRTRLGSSIFEAKLAYGNTDANLQGADQNIEIQLDDIKAVTLSLSGTDWLIRAAIAEACTTGVNSDSNQLLHALRTLPQQLWPEASAVADEIDFVDRTSHYYTLGGQYDDGTWLAQLELGYTETEWKLLQPYVSGYVSVGRRIENFTLYGVISLIENTRKMPVLTPPASLPFLPPEQQNQLMGLFQAAQYSYGISRLDQTSYSLGVRWDFYTDMALKLQWDHSRIGEQGSSLWVRDMPMSHDNSVDLFSFNLSFIF